MTGEPAAPQTEPKLDGRFRILSLDGGGVKGTFTASFLATLETLIGEPVVKHFDLVAGTSTGGIIALALGLGIPARKILDFYVEKGPAIFPATGVRRRALRHWVRSKHQAEALQGALAEVFEDRLLGESETRLVIPSFDAISGDVKLFKTAHHPRFKQDYVLPAYHIALATSAAPTYFPAFSRSDGHRYVDGGVWANNPAAVAVNEAIGVLGANPGAIEVLSVGTTTEPFHIPNRLTSAGRLFWLRPGYALLAQAQEAGAAGLAHAITGHTKRLVRINEATAPGRFPFDSSVGIGELRSLGDRAAAHAEKELGPRFFDRPTPKFKPYYRP